MTLQQFLNGLNSREKKALSEEIGLSLGYLRQLAWDKNRLASAEVAYKVRDSAINVDLPPKQRFGKQDYLNHRQACFIRKSILGGDE